MDEKNAYILGTDYAELQRLGLQHQVWASEAQQGWKNANFSAGMNLIDLGSGPGFCTKEMAYIVGNSGKVTAVEKSESYVKYLDKVKVMHQLSIDIMHKDFNDMTLTSNAYDGMYCRWALAWLPNPKEILSKVKSALKPGGKMVIHEYYDWSSHQTTPTMPTLSKAIAGALKSFKDSEGEIDIGRYLPEMLYDLGMKVTSIRPLTKLATPNDIAWHWPKTFYKIYFPKVAEMGYLTKDEVTQALQEMNDLEKIPGATLFCPYMVEVIAEKI